MFETITYESLLRKMLEKVLYENVTMDTREGSIIYNALAPAAVELQNMYIQLDNVLNETFADTASYDFLVKRCAERGILPYTADNAILKGEFNTEIPIGSRFSLDGTNYVAIECIGIDSETGYTAYKLQCEAIGKIGNEKFGAIIPIDYIDNLCSARITELLVPAQDEENAEQLRKRYFDSLKTQAFGGNKKDYQQKVNNIAGIGGVKVFPAWNGGGTVKLVVIASNYGQPLQQLVENVQNLIDPLTNQGEGVGIAPIGHVVSVVAVNTVLVDFTANITYQSGWIWEDVKPYAEQALDEYFLQLAREWESLDRLVVRISQIETRFLTLPGVVDITDSLINGNPQNYTLEIDEIPVRGLVSGGDLIG